MGEEITGDGTANEDGRTGEATTPSGTRAMHGVVIGVLAGIDERGRPLVAYAGNPSPLPVAARSTSDVDPEAAGREVALLFEGGDIEKPLLIGVVQSGRRPVERSGDTPVPARAPVSPGTPEDIEGSDAPTPARSDAYPSEETTLVPEETELQVDGGHVDIEARERIVLRCGKASITLTRAGKVIIRGAYVSTRSSGANRIKGGSVQIN